MTNETQTNQKRRILIGDDNERMLGSLARMARRYFDRIDASSNHQEVIGLARNGYDVIITDLEYSEGKSEGYDVLQAVRECAPLRVLYTGRGEESDVQDRAKKCGATHVFSKGTADLMEFISKLKQDNGGK
jgi:DNA-binding response OmpR family regulator